MTVWKPILIICILMLAVAVTAYAAPGVEVYGDLNLSGTGTISFPDGSKQTTASTDCNGRYELNSNSNFPDGDGTVTDCRTGLIWLQNAKCTDTSNTLANPLGRLFWADANTWVAGLGHGLCGIHDWSSAGDWRLPTKAEWMAMVQGARKHNFTNPSLTDAAGTGPWAAGNIFFNVQSDAYWSSTAVAAYPDYAWFIYTTDGSVSNIVMTSNNFVWPVRAGQ